MRIVGWTHDVKPKSVNKGDKLSFTVDEDMEIALGIFLSNEDLPMDGRSGNDYQFQIDMLCRIIAQLHEDCEELRSKVRRYNDLDEVVVEQATRLRELGEDP